MSKFNSDKLHVRYLPPASSFSPIEGRKYTLTHSDRTGELFLSIGARFDTAAIDYTLRDEVLGEWTTRNGEYLLLCKVHVNNGEFDEKVSKIRYMIFKKELQIALTGMMYGDRPFFINHPWLLDCPIIVKFESTLPEFQEVNYFGTPRQLLNFAAQGSQHIIQA
ncbi:staygreen family protein [Bacillus massilinigeriensis]|uniref:staygreen family protein n=1 Tax=Bacillus mediterraneensis TaxID=1805474 RepID=UPI0008F84226|nr:staygreen family protein [Bacillus mediterraneensis]